jgi:hypothetical protein
VDNVRVMFRSVGKQKVLFVAIDNWEGTFFKFVPMTSSPEVDIIVSSAVQVFKSMLHSMVMMFIGCGVSL